MEPPLYTCFEPLLDDEVTERDLLVVLREEWQDAVVNGVVAALFVLVVLAWQGTPGWLIVFGMAGAVLLGTALHQAVLVASVVGLRAWRERDAAATG